MEKRDVVLLDGSAVSDKLLRISKNAKNVREYSNSYVICWKRLEAKLVKAASLLLIISCFSFRYLCLVSYKPAPF
jgi:hypothetical protein